ncbi:MAG: acetoacetate decarboxylase family protein, partial [Thermoleophilaceae bacterium]|nr:acetoacetate decarboxylase family protein [Thermoleophilaceae bacterium]
MRASSFFDGVSQVELGTDENSMLAPLFYYDGEAMVGIFPARLSALKKLMPDARMRPARLAPGIGAVTVACFEYRDTDITDYNELAIAIPLNEPYYRPNLPGRALASALRRDQFDVLVHHLPVTTERARTGGRTWYNYPKFVAGIDFE